MSDDQQNYRGNAAEQNPSSQVEQLTLLSRAQSGDAHAFCALVEPQRHRIYRMAAQITCNHEDAEDACQNGLLKAFPDRRFTFARFRAMPSFRHGSREL